MGNGEVLLNLASANFAGLSGNKEVEEKAIKALRKYGVGACGPPGFYGTMGKRIVLFNLEGIELKLIPDLRCPC